MIKQRKRQEILGKRNGDQKKMSVREEKRRGWSKLERKRQKANVGKRVE